MDTKIFVDKFSMVDRLAQFVWWLTWNNCNEDHPCMNSQDLHSELQLELIKGIQCYPWLPEEQLMAVLKRMLDNRVAELIHRFYGTHRKVEKLTISLEIDMDCREEIYEGFANKMSHDEYYSNGTTPTPEELYASKERVERTKARLQPMARRVLDYILNDENDKLDMILRLSMLRAESKFSSPHTNIKPRHVAEAMLLPEKVIKQSFKEISVAYMEVIQEL
jgi:hypothetical protein